jgi:predicted RNA-binding protein with EMAP domain
MKIYDRVKKILELHPSTRNSDKRLIWQVYKDMYPFGQDLTISYHDFMELPAFESITRARRKIQEIHPELQATKEVFEQRALKADSKGQFIFTE